MKFYDFGEKKWNFSSDHQNEIKTSKKCSGKRVWNEIEIIVFHTESAVIVMKSVS